MNPLLKETFVFRPINCSNDLLRYANNTWIPDDGKPDLAFVSKSKPLVYYVTLSSYANVLWTWFDLLLTRQMVGKEFEKDCQYRKGWHTMTTDNKDYLNSRIEYYEENKHKAEAAILDAEYNIEHIEKKLTKYKNHPLYKPEWDKEFAEQER